TYSWNSKHVPKIELEENSPSLSYYAPHIIYYITEAKNNEINQNYLGEVEDLYAWYATFTQNLGKNKGKNLQNVVNQLTEGVVEEEEKVKRIYYWVQDHIKYIAFEEGMRGFIPHEANLVLEKKYGDCKDMANIIHQMLKIAGVESYLTWVGSREKPYDYTTIATPIVDDHMITVWKNLKGEVVFLDATSKYTPFGFPSSMIQGKQALVGISKEDFEVVRIPIITKNENLVADSSFLRLVGDELVGEGK
ncbi:transglutaminase domain-containing protein, partial [Xanthovirga aplysinae]|uniref:transglutaminase domain-containing protein n=1 Tax=Xanthovirga aplysinae TaxID=2529853 RepID=UPI001CA38772